MEKLNEYLQSLLSTCSFELHLEPNKTPYLVSSAGNTEVSSSPILGTQISMLIFPLIPPAVKQELPNRSEIEFVHNHDLGNFNFHIKKSPVGFNVTIRPLLSETSGQTKTIPQEFSDMKVNSAISSLETSTFEPNSPKPVSVFSNARKQDEISANPPAEIKTELSTPPFKAMQVEFPIIECESQIEIVSVVEPVTAADFPKPSDLKLPAKPDEFAAANEFARISPPEMQDIQTAHSFEKTAPAYQPQAIATPKETAFIPVAVVPQAKAQIDSLFKKMAETGASDLHLSVSMPPLVRKDGKIKLLEENQSPLSPESISQLLTSIMPPKNQQEFKEKHDTDFAYEIEGLARFRANIFLDRKGMGGVFRIIPAKITTAEQLGLSSAILNLCSLTKGLVVVTGPTGSGKSTTLCAMINYINNQREDHIITIEDPIEFTHENQKCLINQREVHNHTDSFKNALRAALREDPDILLVGEMRDLETISIAIETAETGHLVFGTLHTTTAASTVDRIIDQFPADRQQQIRVMLSESLKGVIAQTLLPKKGGGRVAALEILIVTPAISNLIREGKTFQIPSAMQTGKNHGMVMLNDALMELVQKGIVEPRDAYLKSVEKTGFEALLTRNGFKI